MGYDFLVAMREPVANAAIESLYDKKPKGVFSGTSTFDNVPVSWDVTHVPTVAFRGFTEAEREQEVKRNPPVEPRPSPNSVLVIGFPELRVRLSEDGQRGEPQQVVKQIHVECALVVYRNTLTAVPVAATFDTGDMGEWTQYLFRQLVVPRALNVAGTVMGAVPLPPITVAKVKFGDIALRVGGGMLVGAACLVEDGAGLEVPDPKSLPESPFFVLVSPRVVQRAAQTSLDHLSREPHEIEGTATFGVANASYHAGIRLDSAHATVDPKAPERIGLQFGFQAFACARADTFGGVRAELEQVGDTVTHVFSSY